MVAASLALAWLIFWAARGRSRVPEPISQPSPRKEVAQNPAAPARPEPRPRGEASADDAAERSLWEKRLARAKKTLDTYIEATHYPPDSRPMSEHPDLRAPHHVEPAHMPLARDDRKLTDARVNLEQDRFFLVGNDTVNFQITCENSDGPAPCEVLSARTSVPPSEAKGAVPPAVDVPFASAAQGIAAASFRPSQQGYANFHGTIRVAIELRVRNESGSASFDVQYTPTAPAAFTGKVREALDGGSLDFFVEMDVTKAGRYLLSGRVDDAAGKTFAYVTFNDELPPGRQEARLQVFGKLVHDQNATSPFRLRDIEGYLLEENTFPDREIMAGMDGVVLTSRAYKMSDFSDDDWDSADKQRHLAEFRKDVSEAQQKAR